MADTISPATGRCYGVARVCHVWEVPRSSFYAAQQAGAADAGPKPSPARRGPKPAISDEDLLAAIHADLARSPWTGEGHRKVWAESMQTRGGGYTAAGSAVPSFEGRKPG